MEIYSELVDSLERCIATCNNCASSCLDEENVQAKAECIKLDLDCADACHLALKLLARDSTHAMSAVKLCKDICAECAAECEKHDQDHCRLCASACRRCEDRCKKFIANASEPVAV